MQKPRISDLGTGKSNLLDHFAPALMSLFLPRPIASSGERVPPSDFDDYRASRKFTAPSCHCAQSGPATESAIYVAVEGEFWGEYVAGCAADRCGYLGK